MKTVNQYCSEIFGEKVYKLSLDGGFTCPTRDGTLGTRGCIFCSQHGSGDFAGNRTLSITEQINTQKEILAKKGAHKFIAYFQAFTNTYAPVSILESKFSEALKHPDIVALSVATRPDCLGDDVLNLLAKLNTDKPIWVELGLQTIHPATAEYIRRGYSLEKYDEAICNLKRIGIENIIVHVILGLPNETAQMIKDTVSYIILSGATGIKLQLLHVLRGTDLADDYEQGLFDVLTLDEYITILADCIEMLPDSVIVHRMTGDGNKRELIAPLWSADKKNVLNAINAELRRRGLIFS